MRYQKGSTSEAIQAAQKAARKNNQTAYITPTYSGLTITWRRPPTWARFYEVLADGTATLIQPEFC